jgi:hypothetical protein
MGHAQETAVSLFPGLTAAASQSHFGCSSFKFSPSGFFQCSSECFILSFPEVMVFDQVGLPHTLAMVLACVSHEQS